MPKTHLTPRSQLVCGKLDALHEAIVAGDTITALDLVSAVRQDCERMEAKLVARKAEVAGLLQRLDTRSDRP